MDHLFLIRIIVDGGIMMVPLIAFSVVGLAAIIERGFALRPSKVLCIDRLIELEGLIKQGYLEEAYNMVKDEKSPMLRIVKVALLHSGRDKHEIKEAIENAGRLELPELQKNFTLLNTLAVISPLVGLLGTVLGMMQVFSASMNDGGFNMAILSQGISQALITTVTGLIVAVPCLVFYNLYFRMTDNLTNEMEKYSLTLMNLIIRASEQSRQGIKIELPAAQTSTKEAVSKKSEITVSDTAHLYINGKEVNPNDLLPALQALFKSSSDQTLTIRADGKVAHAHVVHVMDIAKQAGFLRLSIAAAKPPSGHAEAP
ncbi:hypothetical protein CHS0354_027362 [Potamilus streckersoni]|uniref:MotA/TolQ/ExbB proton channel domain-containing protein n=1 Tax=Potamilus streckersoni TaxID=2493646 RepID=A0AAE0SQ05_9BIVA|nr:hypothetical protein CHS0354_027362 [Potamilus streckersoni]